MERGTVVERSPWADGAAAVGWALGAFVVALALTVGTTILFIDVLDAAIDPITGGAVVPDWIHGSFRGLVVGGAIGGVIGSRVRRGAVVLAAATALLFLSMSPFRFFTESVQALSVTTHVAAAVAVARLMRERAVRRDQVAA